VTFVRRPLAALLVFVLLCVPSLTRVYQQLDGRSTAATLSASFLKSVDCPPSKIIVDTPAAHAVGVLLAAFVSPIDRTWPVSCVEPLCSADTGQPDSLRAPPAR
jgi:hypothetical protein